MQDPVDTRVPLHRLDERTLISALLALTSGDANARLPTGGRGVNPEVARAFNELAKEHQRLRQEVQRLRGAAEGAATRSDAEQELERFRHVAAHDLQEPVRTALAYTTLLSRRHGEALDEDGRLYLAFVSEAAERMHTLLRDLLSYDRASDTRGDLIPTDCDAALDRALDALRGEIAARGGQVTREPLPIVLGDPRELHQVFEQLLANALKFSHGAPRVHVRASRREGAWQLEVRDQGIGIAPEHHEAVFGMFRRVHPRGGFEGNGVGLAIVRRIVERHGGQIWVESAPGRGATFLIVLAAVEERAWSAEARKGA